MDKIKLIILVAIVVSQISWWWCLVDVCGFFLENLSFIQENNGLYEEMKKTYMVSGDPKQVILSDKEHDKWSNSETCEMKKSIIFLKTHKTGSSTITNILNRFADEKGSAMLLPYSSYNSFFWPALFSWTFVDARSIPWSKNVPWIISNHARLMKSSLSALITQDHYMITILRHPVQQFVSVFFYQGIDRLLNLTNTSNAIEEFLIDSENYMKHARTHFLYNDRVALPLLNDGQWFDLGAYWDRSQSGLQNYSLETALPYIMKDFDLVLINELFDESLVLMSKRLCWSNREIYYHPHLQRAHNKDAELLTDEVRSMIEARNSVDMKLYSYFKERLLNQIKEYGEEKLAVEIAQFREENRRISDACFLSSVTRRGSGVDEEVKEYRLRPDVPPNLTSLCEKMIKSEIDYLDYFRKNL